MSERVLVLGGTGMLGAMMVRVLREQGLHVELTCRDPLAMPLDKRQQAGWHLFEANAGHQAFRIWVGDNQPARHIDDGKRFLEKADWIINCIGITKPVIDADPSCGTKTAIEVNALFPHVLARSLSSHQRIIQIATDCVFSGRQQDPAHEKTPHDALDDYGKTKSLGENNLPNVMLLRTSIIGPEFRPEKKFLLEWFLGQPKDARVNGYTDHYWNGMTTLQFSKVCAGIIKNYELFRSGVHHLVPASGTSKFHLLTEMGFYFNRPDIMVEPRPAGEKVNRLLETNDPGFNRKLWKGADYVHPPQLDGMLAELASYVKT